jgi:hypothetical protein
MRLYQEDRETPQHDIRAAPNESDGDEDVRYSDEFFSESARDIVVSIVAGHRGARCK